jgi:tRNA 2-selenouridine synthase
MNDRINILKNNTPLIDLRAPIEFNKGAFPSSVNIPILNDAQRSKVGIKYKKQGNNAAEKLGFDLVKNKQNEIVDLWRRFIKKNPSTYIYCMRGGKRSQIAKSWLRYEGINVPAVKGGYKALRNTAIEILNSVNKDQKSWIILAGRTGSGKTAILKNLNSAIDLEKHAMHRGSAFGGLAKQQPTAINFENNLASEYIKHNSNILFLEDESKMIGKIILPNAWHKKMKESKIIIIELAIEERIINIATEYIYNPLENGLSKEKLNKVLQTSLFKIQKRLGLKLYNEISMKIKNNLIDSYKIPHEEWIKELLINYYDPMYDYQLETKKDRCLLKSNKSEVVKFLTQIEAKQSL